MATGPIVSAPGQTALQKADYYHGLSVGGIAVALAGLAVGAWSYWQHARERDMHG